MRRVRLRKHKRTISAEDGTVETGVGHNHPVLRDLARRSPSPREPRRDLSSRRPTTSFLCACKFGADMFSRLYFEDARVALPLPRRSFGARGPARRGRDIRTALESPRLTGRTGIRPARRGGEDLGAGPRPWRGREAASQGDLVVRGARFHDIRSSRSSFVSRRMRLLSDVRIASERARLRPWSSSTFSSTVSRAMRR